MITPRWTSSSLQVFAVATVIIASHAGALRADEAPPPDQVTSKGTVLRGTVTGLSADGLTLEPEYGKGSVAIKWVNVEDVKTAGSFQVLYGDDEELDAPLQGLSGGNLLIGADAATATPVEIKSIHSGVPIGPEGPSWQDRMRSSWRYWDGSFDAAVNVQQATIDTTGFLLAFNTMRRKDPTRLIFQADYRYSTQTKETTDPVTGETTDETTTIEDRAFGLMRGEYDIIPRLYAFASGDATYDAVQKLSIRGVPKAGLGYLFWEQKLDEERRNFLSGEVGGAWVYEDYFTSAHTPSRNYVAVAFGAAAGYYLPYGAHFGWKLDYLPAVDDFANDYLLRNELGLTMPLVEPIAAKFSLVDEYDNTPAANADRNSLYLAFGLSVLW